MSILKLKGVSTNAFTRIAALIGVIGIIAAVVVPFVLSVVLAIIGGREENSLPWYVWTIGLLLLLLTLLVGRYMFLTKNRDAEDLSISPKYR